MKKAWILIVGLAVAIPTLAVADFSADDNVTADALQGKKKRRRRKKRTRKYSYKRHVWPTIRRYCVRCHRGKKAAEGLDLSKRKKAYKSMVNADSKQTEGYQIVYPGEPTLSYLVFKLSGQHKHPNVRGKGARMPKGRRHRIAGYRRDRIILWIKQGAKYN